MLLNLIACSTPTVVLVMSLLFIAVVVCLHVWGKFGRCAVSLFSRERASEQFGVVASGGEWPGKGSDAVLRCLCAVHG